MNVSNNTLKKIIDVGVVNSIESGTLCSVSIVYRLLLGYLCGLPAIAISVNAAISYISTIIFELPGGIFSDYIGNQKTVFYGYKLQIIASVMLFTSIILFKNDLPIFWVFIVLEGIFDAMGSAMISGAKESLQDRILSNLDPSLEKQKFLLMERYGRFNLILLPTLSMFFIWISNSFFHMPELVILLMGTFWYLILVKTQVNVKKYLSHEYIADNSERSNKSSFPQFCISFFQYIKNSPKSLLANILSLSTYQFMFGFIHGYIVVSILRDNIFPNMNIFIVIFIANISFILGRISRSFILPKIAESYSSETIRLIGQLLLITLSLFMFFSLEINLTKNTVTSNLIILLFPILFDLFIGLTARPLIGEILNSTEDEFKASVMSFSNLLCLLVSALYSVYLTLLNIGVPSFKELWSVCIFGTALGFFLFLVQKLPVLNKS